MTLPWTRWSPRISNFCSAETSANGAASLATRGYLVQRLFVFWRLCTSCLLSLQCWDLGSLIAHNSLLYQTRIPGEGGRGGAETDTQVCLVCIASHVIVASVIYRHLHGDLQVPVLQCRHGSCMLVFRDCRKGLAQHFMLF